eukprot:TRINITY_DN9444_c1_g1_i3.p3 TRINITY_DN9444_c1_g1~~TRINITY_DN9444_c1_g1_i3.p3  ORF type:complete len:100 (+),score=17.33 TRINITY_DN9444_c1_g1_i3:351-650(+)
MTAQPAQAAALQPHAQVLAAHWCALRRTAQFSASAGEVEVEQMVHTGHSPVENTSSHGPVPSAALNTLQEALRSPRRRRRSSSGCAWHQARGKQRNRWE